MIFNIPVPAFSTVTVNVPLLVLLYVAYAIIMVPVFRYALRDGEGRNESGDLASSVALAAVWPISVIVAIEGLEAEWETLAKKRRHG